MNFSLAINSSTHHTTHDNKEAPDKHQSADTCHHWGACGLWVNCWRLPCLACVQPAISLRSWSTFSGFVAQLVQMRTAVWPNGKEVFGAKPVELLVAEDWKLLVGGAVDEEWYALPPLFPLHLLFRSGKVFQAFECCHRIL